MDNRNEDLFQTYESAEDFSSSPPFVRGCSFCCFYRFELRCVSFLFDVCPLCYFDVARKWILIRNELTLFFMTYWRSIVMVVAPFALIPIITYDDTPQHRFLYILSLMSIFWSSEALPLPISSLIPVVLFPFFGILSTKETCMAYMNEANMNLVCGLILALAVQNSNLHKRVALRIITIIGCSQRKLNFGLTAVTTFVSMWVSNAAAISTMVPIIKAVLEELENEGIFQLYKHKKSNRRNSVYDTGINPSNITVCYFMGTAYVTSIGCMGSILGSATNLAFKVIYESRFPSQHLSFLSWMYLNVPLVLINTFATWIYLQWYFMGMFRPKSKEAKLYTLGKEGEKVVRNVIIKRYNELGPISQREIQVSLLFVTSILLNFFRDPGFIKGWATYFPKVMIEEASSSILIVIALFVLPGNWKWLLFLKSRDGEYLVTPGLITWKVINQHLSWSLLFLLGGGFALAHGGEITGMSMKIGEALAALSRLPFLLLLFLICLIIQIITEFVSSIVIANVMLPLLAELAVSIKVHPLYLMYPATLSCAMGFQTIFGTPHNLVAAEVAHIRTRDIAFAGIGPSIFSLLTIWLVLPTWGLVVYPELNTFPSWANSTNSTD